MKRANAVDIRNALETGKAMADAGLDFVPMPVLHSGDKSFLLHAMNRRMEKIAEAAEQEEVSKK